VCAALVLGSASAQNETTLRRIFEGKSVRVKVDMPGTQQGIDIHPESSIPLDFRKVADKIKRFGIGVHSGDSVMITKLHVKKKLIEF
jgi:rRNA processing protein Krr1/Pno1